MSTTETELFESFVTTAKLWSPETASDIINSIDPEDISGFMETCNKAIDTVEDLDLQYNEAYQNFKSQQFCFYNDYLNDIFNILILM